MNTVKQTFGIHTQNSTAFRRLIALSLGLVAFAAYAVSLAEEGEGAQSANESVSQEMQYNRLILLKFSDAATSEEIETVKQRFCVLGRSYAGLEEAVWVADQTLCEKSDFTHAVLLRFSCPVAAANYREHPECREFEKESTSAIVKTLEMKYQAGPSNASGPNV